MEWKKRIYCGELDGRHIEKDVLLMGWVDAVRDHGHLLFVHMRDITGIVQVVFDPKVNKESYRLAVRLSEEYVIQVRGRVRARGKGTENPNLATGEIEVFVSELEILSESKPLPFKISEKAMVFGDELNSSPENVDEELRLKYRYLDIRRPSKQRLLIKRYEIIKCIRGYLDELKFFEIETPFLTKSTPEGARDYLVPSRVHQGRFYALPQSPQLFKQILMMSGTDRYFQIARCFRDEDLRPNRQPEFTQLDLEASFIDEEFIYEIIEELTTRMFSVGNIRLPRPFPRMTYREAMDLYGSDRPDLRFGMEFHDVTHILSNTKYSIFRQIVRNGGRIKGFCVKGQADALSKNVLQNEYAMKIVPMFGGKGMTWMKVMNGELQSNIVQFFSQAEQHRMIEEFHASDGDILMMIADESVDLGHKILNSLRSHVANRLNLIPDDLYMPVWITDFPLFELKDDELGSQHHPFTMPDRTDFDPGSRDDLLSLNSRAYDLVVNGEELGGGSIRIHRMEIQKKIFQALGLTNDEVEMKFGFFLRALEYGAPPHGGLALGLDRTVAMILKAESIRDVIAFPKNRRALCPLSQAPSPVDPDQIHELGISIGRTDKYTISQDEAGTQGKGLQRAIKYTNIISKEEVKHVAKLARLKLNNDELEAYQKDLNAVLEHFDTLQELDTDQIPPMSHVLEIKNVWRQDIPDSNRDSEALLSNAPMRESGFFKVPKILEG